MSTARMPRIEIALLLPKGVGLRPWRGMLDEAPE